jgi:glutathione S-transferase
MEVDGEPIAQSQAILRYAGKLSGLYPGDPMAALKVDEILGAIEDVIQVRTTFPASGAGGQPPACAESGLCMARRRCHRSGRRMPTRR